MTLYTKYNGRRKPERLTTSTYSAVDYDEAETVAADYNALAARAEAISRLLPKDEQNAFYELVLFPVKACANLNEMYVAGARNQLYAKQGRLSANDFADMARRDFANDSALMKYYNTEFAGGKWDHFQDDVHIGYTSWAEPRVYSALSASTGFKLAARRAGTAAAANPHKTSPKGARAILQGSNAVTP